MVNWFSSFWRNFDLAKRVIIGACEHFVLGNTLKEWSEIRHANVSWPPTDLIRSWARAVGFPYFGEILTWWNIRSAYFLLFLRVRPIASCLSDSPLVAKGCFQIPGSICSSRSSSISIGLHARSSLPKTQYQHRVLLDIEAEKWWITILFEVIPVRLLWIMNKRKRALH